MRFATHNRVATAIRLQWHRAQACKAETQAVKRMMNALAIKDRSLATEWFNQAMAWNAFAESLEDSFRLVGDPRTPVYAVEAWFLRDQLAALTPRRDEEAVYITGPIIGGVRVLSRPCQFALDEQSPVYARGNSQSCLAALIQILDNGNELHAIAHSHPGSGASATQQSDIDMTYLGGIQKAGANVIGIIFSRDGFTRFFTHNKPFVVHVTGKGVTHVLENVYKLESVGQV